MSLRTVELPGPPVAGIAFVRAAKIAENHSTLAETTRLRDKAILLMRSPLLSQRERKYLQGWARRNGVRDFDATSSLRQPH